MVLSLGKLERFDFPGATVSIVNGSFGPNDACERCEGILSKGDFYEGGDLTVFNRMSIPRLNNLPQQIERRRASNTQSDDCYNSFGRQRHDVMLP